MPTVKNEVKATGKAKSEKKNFFQRAIAAVGTFFKNIGAELKKVTWPTKKELIMSTLSVFAVCIVVGLVIYASDALLGLLVNLIRG